MSFPVRPLSLMVLCALVAAPLAAADPPSPPAEPTQKDALALLNKYEAEREQAHQAKFPAEALANADQLAKRGRDALKAENFKAAARLFRDARWQLPYVPTGLPQHVARVLGESRMRQADRVNALAYGPGGAVVASASRDGTVKVWDLGNGREVCTYRGHLDQPDDPTKNGTNVLGVTDAAFHPKGKVVASACGNQVHLWDPTTGKHIKTVLNLGKTDKPVKAVAYSPDGQRLAVGADDGILRVIESDSGKAVYASPSRNARIERVCFSPNGKLVALGDAAGQVAVYVPEGKGNQLAMSVQGADIPEVMGVAFTADGAAVFSCGRDGKVRLTAGPTPDGGNAPNTATKLREFVGHSGAVTGLAVTGDGALLVTGGDDKTVRVWDVKTGKQLRSFQGHTTRVTAVAARPDGRQIASASDDGAVRVWDLSTSDEHRAMTDAKESLWAVAVSPDGKRLAAAGADKKIRVYDPESGKVEATLDAGAAMTSLAFFPDGNRLAAGGGDNKVKIWDVGAKKVTQELTGFALAVLAVAVSEDGKLVVAGSADSTARGFDPAGKELWKWPARKAVCAVAVRKGGKEVAVGLADGVLVVLDVSGTAPKEVAQQSAHTAGVACVAYSPDGSRLATVGGDGALRVWTVNDNGAPAPLVRFEGQPSSGTTGFSPLTAVAFAPDNRHVAAAGADGVVRVWDVQTRSEVRDLRGNTDWVTSLAFSPDGRFLASAAAEKDNAVRVFELPSLDNGGGVAGHLRSVNAVAVSPNGKLIATASTDQTIKVWDAGSGKEVATLIGNADTPFALAFLGNDALVMGGSLPTGGAGRLHYWDISPPRLTKSVATGEVYTVVPSADGARVAVWAARPAVGDTVKNNTYELYTAKGELIGQPYTDKGRNVRSATFTPGLAWAVAGDETGGVQVFDLAKRERVGGNMPLFERTVVDIGVTADRKYIVATDDEGQVKVGELKNGKLEVVAKGKAHKGGVRALYVSPTGKSFLTVGNDRELKLWSLTDLKPESLTELRAWQLPVSVNGAAFAPDGKTAVTANADGTAYVLELP